MMGPKSELKESNGVEFIGGMRYRQVKREGRAE